MRRDTGTAQTEDSRLREAPRLHWSLGPPAEHEKGKLEGSRGGLGRSQVKWGEARAPLG